MKLIPGHKRLGPRLTFTCEHCLQPFQRRPGYVRTKPVRFCSSECREASKKRKPILIDEITAHVPLTQGMIAIIDASDIEKVSRFTWHASHAGDGRFYAKGHMQDGRNDYLHRFILDFPDSEVDHRDGDTLNNQRSNLRCATSSQNSANTSVRSGRSLPKGVYLTKSKRYEAKLSTNGRQVFIGVFDSPEDAARAYDDAATLHFGEFARLNFPDD